MTDRTLAPACFSRTLGDLSAWMEETERRRKKKAANAGPPYPRAEDVANAA